jgi:hypothetical protein
MTRPKRQAGADSGLNFQFPVGNRFASALVDFTRRRSYNPPGVKFFYNALIKFIAHNRPPVSESTIFLRETAFVADLSAYPRTDNYFNLSNS